MFRLLALLLPALMPSWAFFKAVEASPRVQWRALQGQGSAPAWQEFRPRPQHLGLLGMIKRVFWNPTGNENLYLVSLAERMVLDPSDHSKNEIRAILTHAFVQNGSTPNSDTLLQFQLVFVTRSGDDIVEAVAFIDDPVRAHPPSV